MIGGQITDHIMSNKTWTFSWTSQKWTPQPDLQDVRGSTACGLYKGSTLVVAGGIYGPYLMWETSEILEMSDNDGWKYGPKFGTWMHSMGMITDDQGDVFFLGGTNGQYSFDTIYKFSYEGWINHGKMGLQRYFFHPLRLPQLFVDTHCPQSSN